MTLPVDGGATRWEHADKVRHREERSDVAIHPPRHREGRSPVAIQGFTPSGLPRCARNDGHGFVRRLLRGCLQNYIKMAASLFSEETQCPEEVAHVD